MSKKEPYLTSKTVQERTFRTLQPTVSLSRKSRGCILFTRLQLQFRYFLPSRVIFHVN